MELDVKVSMRLFQVCIAIGNMIKEHGCIKSILEIGCGNGESSVFFRKLLPDAHITGIDIDSKKIEQAKKNDPDGDYHCCDFLSYKPTPNVYDMITFIDVIEHFNIAFYPRVMNVIESYTHPGTIIPVNIPSEDFINYLNKHDPGKLQEVDNPVSMIQLINLFRQGDFHMTYFKEYGVEYNRQYQLYLFKRKKPITLTKHNFEKV